MSGWDVAFTVIVAFGAAIIVLLCHLILAHRWRLPEHSDGSRSEIPNDVSKLETTHFDGDDRA
jgi:hypothetical protein